MRVALKIFDASANDDIFVDGKLFFQPVLVRVKKDEIDGAGFIGAPDFVGKAFAGVGEMLMHAQSEGDDFAVGGILDFRRKAAVDEIDGTVPEDVENFWTADEFFKQLAVLRPHAGERGEGTE